MDERTVLAEKSHRSMTAMTADVLVPPGDRSDGAVGKDNGIAQVRAAVVRRAGENGAVKTGKCRLRRMRDCDRAFDRLPNCETCAPQFRHVRDVNRQSGGLGVDDGVKRAAVGDVRAQMTRAKLHQQSRVQNERGRW